MNDGNIIQKLIDGASLKTRMIPDPSIPTNRPKHIEGFQLPHVIINGEVFWGMSRNVHCFHKTGELILIEGSSFCYSNGPDSIFFSYNLLPEGLTGMPLSRYESHQFIATDDYHLVWDSDILIATDHIRKSIEEGCQLKVVMLDDDNVWNIHPVDLPMYHLDDGSFLLKTELFPYPLALRDNQNIKACISSFTTAFRREPDKTMFKNSADPYQAFYGLGSDGSYYNVYDVVRDTRKKYKHLKVFARQ